MAEKGEYDVLRLIQHNQVCYISSGCIRGAPMINWLKYHQGMPKEEFMRIIRLLAKQLDNIHKCRKKKYYQYVNPYSVIMGEDGNVYFLDLSVSSNEETLQKMRRRIVREYFLPPEAPYYQEASVELDIYGFGRTLQYLLSETELEPKLNRSEERKFKKIISRCLGRQSKQAFQSISEIQKYFPESKTEKPKTSQRKRKAALIGGAAAIAFIILSGFLKSCQSGKSDTAVQEKEYQETVKEAEETETICMEMGLLCLTKLKDYERGSAYFQRAKGALLAGEMELLCQALQGEEVKGEELRKALENIEDQIPENEKELYYQCLLKGYHYLDNRKDLEAILRIGEICLDTGEKEEQPQILEIMAGAMEKSGQNKEAVKVYERQMKVEEGKEEREELYKKMAALMVSDGTEAEALKKLEEGIRECPESKELRIEYLKNLLRISKEDRGICLQTINRFLGELPVLEQEEEFQKLMREYGIKTGGGNAWSEEADT